MNNGEGQPCSQKVAALKLTDTGERGREREREILMEAKNHPFPLD
jgi:hypothetical protein